ncbi:hypothetical protein GWI33_012047 [Rhynchophorus ferrugineus]|uniref:Uncharacterized protein n=1 Tax=Rhynchophorus ferrugineus TaxID=354439 RepID=A0A834I765_RHYFE|nr:hypothetical protein GWI33_012047 [Rhynchophorus ferrugineus]
MFGPLGGGAPVELQFMLPFVSARADLIRKVNCSEMKELSKHNRTCGGETGDNQRSDSLCRSCRRLNMFAGRLEKNWQRESYRTSFKDGRGAGAVCLPRY